MEKFIVSEIAKETAKRMGVPISSLRSKSRKKEYVRARAVAMYIARNKTDASLEEIGFVFNRHHATVINSIKMVENSRKLIMIAKIVNEKFQNAMEKSLTMMTNLHQPSKSDPQ